MSGTVMEDRSSNEREGMGMKVDFYSVERNGKTDSSKTTRRDIKRCFVEGSKHL